MKANKATTVGFIGFSDSWGDLWVKAFKALAEPMGLKMVAEERYARADTSVAGQALKLVAAKPDVVLVAASGAGAALPQIALQRARLQGHHLPDARRRLEGLHHASPARRPRAPSCPPGRWWWRSCLPPSPQTSAALEHLKAYEAKYGAGTITQFSGHAFDVGQILKRVVPVALKSAKPGTKEFRDALLKAIESEKEIAASHGVYNFTPTDHAGLDERGRVLLTVKDGDLGAGEVDGKSGFRASGSFRSRFRCPTPEARSSLPRRRALRSRQKERAARRTNGPSLGRKRPRWAATSAGGRRRDRHMGLFGVQCNGRDAAVGRFSTLSVSHPPQGGTGSYSKATAKLQLVQGDALAASATCYSAAARRSSSSGSTSNTRAAISWRVWARPAKCRFLIRVASSRYRARLISSCRACTPWAGMP